MAIIILFCLQMEKSFVVSVHCNWLTALNDSLLITVPPVNSYLCKCLTNN